jgi:Domain of unknown function (DUF3576)
MNTQARTLMKAAICLVAVGALSACSMFRGDDERQTGQSRDSGSSGTGVSLFGGGDDNDGAQAGIGVNSFLWRASLDTLQFMPLASADPFGGVIITDWYSDPATPNERFKATVYILDSRLRADALNVSIFRQQAAGAGWAGVTGDPDTEIQIENAILTRARQLRLSNLNE